MTREPGRATILVVDDEPMDRMVLDDMLTNRGYQVLLARSGKEALQQFQAGAGDIDLVLLDWTLPDISGMEVHRQLKAHGNETGRFTPVIMVTARKDEESKVAGLEGGLEDYVTKP
jgi:DNA-binding response OmpR family regulator